MVLDLGIWWGFRLTWTYFHLENQLTFVISYSRELAPPTTTLAPVFYLIFVKAKQEVSNRPCQHVEPTLSNLSIGTSSVGATPMDLYKFVLLFVGVYQRGCTINQLYNQL